MADTKNTTDQIESLTREELARRYGIYRDLFHRARDAHSRLLCEYTAYSDLHADTDAHWRTALARAERAERLLDATEDQVKDVGRSLNKAMDQCNTLGAEISTLRAQAATDAATIAELQASLAVMTNDRDHLMKSASTATPPAAPDGARTTPYPPLDAEISFVGNVAVVNFVERPPPALRPFDAACAIARKYSGQTKPEPKFKAGQRVRFVSKVASAHDGAVGTIVTVLPDGLFIVRFHNHLLDGCYAEDQLAPEGAQP